MSAASYGAVTGPRRGLHLGRIVMYLVLAVAVVVWLVPFAWAFATSLKPDAETTVAPSPHLPGARATGAA